ASWSARCTAASSTCATAARKRRRSASPRRTSASVPRAPGWRYASALERPAVEDPMHDLVIRGGNVVDGTGAAPRTADVAIDAGRVTQVAAGAGRGREEIDARGKLVTPGFVDVHTHYDGQATWDELLTPSCWHGVTTLVMGNCGVGFAPVRPGQEQFLIGLMEGVEDIPGTALSAGMQWGWETFPEYLDVLERLPHALDFGTQVGHGPVRAYVMGDRGAKNEPATPADIAQMAKIVKEAIAAGALGFS